MACSTLSIVLKFSKNVATGTCSNSSSSLWWNFSICLGLSIYILVTTSLAQILRVHFVSFILNTSTWLLKVKYICMIRIAWLHHVLVLVVLLLLQWQLSLEYWFPWLCSHLFVHVFDYVLNAFYQSAYF